MTAHPAVTRAAIEVSRDGDTDVLVLRTGSEPDDAQARAQLVREAVARARARHTRHVITRIDATAPGAGVLLAQVQACIGLDVEQVVLRRAGSTVVVDLTLLP